MQVYRASRSRYCARAFEPHSSTGGSEINDQSWQRRRGHWSRDDNIEREGERRSPWDASILVGRVCDMYYGTVKNELVGLYWLRICITRKIRNWHPKHTSLCRLLRREGWRMGGMGVKCGTGGTIVNNGVTALEYIHIVWLELLRTSPDTFENERPSRSKCSN